MRGDGIDHKIRKAGSENNIVKSLGVFTKVLFAVDEMLRYIKSVLVFPCIIILESFSPDGFFFVFPIIFPVGKIPREIERNDLVFTRIKLIVG